MTYQQGNLNGKSIKYYVYISKTNIHVYLRVCTLACTRSRTRTRNVEKHWTILKTFPRISLRFVFLELIISNLRGYSNFTLEIFWMLMVLTRPERRDFARLDTQPTDYPQNANIFLSIRSILCSESCSPIKRISASKERTRHVNTTGKMMKHSKLGFLVPVVPPRYLARLNAPIYARVASKLLILVLHNIYLQELYTNIRLIWQTFRC